jgi:hypothetical protein
LSLDPRGRGLAEFLAAALVRFWLGTAGGLAGGYLAFRGMLFRPEHPAFHSLAVGMLAAGILTLVRMSLRGQAFTLALAYGALQLAIAEEIRWATGLAGALFGLGLVVVAEIYHELAERGFRFGKFLIVGPLLGGVALAVAPIGHYEELIVLDSLRPLLLQLFIGVVVGDGVGLGVELAELIPWDARSGARATSQPAPSETTTAEPTTRV